MRLLPSLLLVLSVLGTHALAQDANDIPRVKHEYQVRTPRSSCAEY